MDLFNLDNVRIISLTLLRRKCSLNTDSTHYKENSLHAVRYRICTFCVWHNVITSGNFANVVDVIEQFTVNIV